MDVDGNKRVFQRLGFSHSNSSNSNSGFNNNNNRQQKVCFLWREGRCNRSPCPYLHRELRATVPPHQQPQTGSGFSASSKRGFGNDHSNLPRRKSNFNNTWGRGQGGAGGGGVVKKTEKICDFWVKGNCKFGDDCRYIHSWCTGAFSLLTQLEGHQKSNFAMLRADRIGGSSFEYTSGAKIGNRKDFVVKSEGALFEELETNLIDIPVVVSGISLPSGSDKLYTGSKDETVRVWDCQSGQCAGVINLGGEVGCMLSEGPWVFVGLRNGVKAWNAQTGTDLSLDAPGGQVHALVVGNDLLFAGTQDGTILAWKYSVLTNTFEPAASLKGHNLAVVTLVVGANKMYSGSMDNSIRVWSLDTLQCVQTLTEHTSVVMSVLCWDQFLLSCSLDKTIKVWVAADNGNLEVTYTHNEEYGLLTLCGMHDAEAKPVLLCSSNDNTIRVYDLPSFSERGKLYSKQEVRSIQVGPGGLFFTGDGTGEVRVWKWLAEPTSAA